MTLLDPPETDSEGDATISIASAPHEETLMVATQMRDTAFKRVLKTMPIGTAVNEGACGDLILQNDSTRAAVFLAGGIGITPVFEALSIGQRRRSCRRVFLFYSSRQPEDAAFLADLRSLERDDPKYKLIASMTEMEKSHQPWTVEPIDRSKDARKAFEGRCVTHLHRWSARYGERFARDVKPSRDE